MKNELSEYSIMILGGNPETGALVDVANAIGLRTIVVDPNPAAPAKRNASVSYDIDVTDLARVEEVIRGEGVNGILVGVADVLVPYYQKLCERNGFYCYASETIVQALSSKSSFAETCKRYDIAVTPNYKVDYRNRLDVEQLPFPLVLKPVDNGAGVGISVCRNPEEFSLGVEKALSASLRKEILIEKLMDCDDMFAYYTFIDGEPHLSALADRHKTSKQGQFSSVCIAAEYPSKHTERFSQEVHPKLLNMFNGLGIRNGVLLIQFFVDESEFYAYDPGFRLQGEAPHIYLKHFNGFDQREMLLRFAISGAMYQGDFNLVNDYNFKNKTATTLWVLLKAGKLGRVVGLDAVQEHPNVIMILQRFKQGDTVTEAMLGTERQVFARIYTVADSKQESAAVLGFIENHLLVLDETGENMILDCYRPCEAL